MDRKDFLIAAMKTGAFESLVEESLKDIRQSMANMQIDMPADQLKIQYIKLKTRETVLLEFKDFISKFRNQLGG